MGKEKKKNNKGGEYDFEKLPANYDTVPEPFEHRRLIVEFNGVLSELIEERAMTEHLAGKQRDLNKEIEWRDREIKRLDLKVDSQQHRIDMKDSDLSESSFKFKFAIVFALVMCFFAYVAGVQSANQFQSTPPVKESSDNEVSDS